MSLVGTFPGIENTNRRTIRGPVNPLDKSTVVSILPKEIDETKPTISPGRFIIPPGTYEKPAFLVVGPSSWWREIDLDQPLLEIPVSSIQIADSVVKDYCNGIIACDMNASMPGLFYIPGEVTREELFKSYKKPLDEAKRRQTRWFETLVKFGDALWARSNGNPLSVAEDMRMAARELNLTATKEWMKDFTMTNMVRCKACGSLKNPDFPICASCHFPDPDHPMTAKLLDMKSKM
jgi:hypothetical protein